MPSYKVHLGGGLLTYLLIINFLTVLQPTKFAIFQGLLFCLLGALFPDVDVKSKGQKLFYSLLLLLLAFLLWQQKFCLFAIVSFMGIIPILVRHRGIFHHVWFLLLLTTAASWVIRMHCGSYEQIMLSNCWYFLAGALSHVVLDRFVSKIKNSF